MTFSAQTEAETIALGRNIGARLHSGDIIALQGTLGAGKTTITKGIAQALGVQETITSPTFCLISEYEGTMPLYHMDVYRLEGSDEFVNLGAEDMLYGRGVTLIEWSEKIMDEHPQKTIILRLTPNGDGSRTVTLENWP
ncbi:MAG: tRNA (adenosine(37)-N6)-threonylcarbamoyltransferase complex ATPase subunit type 1 TsaE, partial [Treponemataceae bacterium]|nr:tRNA (adenosine(37)-N6)-threonylcarbamoyltransferase complex ATPase subunit type 1 TsaE [Treponemataceae bacterium]